MTDTIPRRLSVHDDGYDHDLGSRLCVCLDGVAQSEVIAFDQDEGTILRYVTSPDGKLALNDEGDDLRRECLRGTVTVEVRARSRR